MQTLSHLSPQRTPTTEMEVTSIRLERDLKDRLKQIAGNQGYQALIREVLWDYVQQHSAARASQWSREDVRASVVATAQQEEQCALTGTTIHPGEQMMLGWTGNGEMIPISMGGLDEM